MKKTLQTAQNYNPIFLRFGNKSLVANPYRSSFKATYLGGVLAFLDLHAHSRRHGAFTLSNPSTHALPDFLSEIDDQVFDRRLAKLQTFVWDKD